MDYKDILMSLSNEDIIHLFNQNKLKWSDFHVVKHKEKLESFTYEQLDNLGIEKNLKETNYRLVDNMNSFSNKSNIYKKLEDFFNQNAIEIIKRRCEKVIGGDSYLVEKYLKENPEKKEFLRNHLEYIDEKSIPVIFGLDMTDVAQYINDKKLSLSALFAHKEKFKVAPLNTLINEENYSSKAAIEGLMSLFPRDIPFSHDVAMNMLKIDKEIYFNLPMKNQASLSLLIYTTNNTLYGDGDWGSISHEKDKTNISGKKVSPQILSFIEENEEGRAVAVIMVENNHKNISHINVQKLINNPEFAPEFARFKNLLNDEQKLLAGVYNKNNVPDYMYQNMEWQTSDVLDIFLQKATSQHEITRAFEVLLARKGDFIKISEESKNVILKNLELLLEDVRDSSLSSGKVDSLMTLIISGDKKDYHNMKVVEIKSENKDFFQRLMKDRLDVTQICEYLEYSPSEKRKRLKLK